MDNRGYANRIVLANKEADSKSPGVMLGRYCISKDYSVRDVAEYFGVSRMTIYKWFTGEWIPRKVHETKINEVLKKAKFVQ
jgi:transcriptional regulator with XRE-family HTH domain